jgi:hypothetical protein
MRPVRELVVSISIILAVPRIRPCRVRVKRAESRGYIGTSSVRPMDAGSKLVLYAPRKTHTFVPRIPLTLRRMNMPP